MFCLFEFVFCFVLRDQAQQEEGREHLSQQTTNNLRLSKRKTVGLDVWKESDLICFLSSSEWALFLTTWSLIHISTFWLWLQVKGDDYCMAVTRRSRSLSAKRSSSQGQELGHKSSTLLFSKLISRIPSPLSARVINSKQDIRNTSHFSSQRIGVKTLGSHLEFTAEPINQVFPRSSISFLKFSNQFKKECLRTPEWCVKMCKNLQWGINLH